MSGDSHPERCNAVRHGPQADSGIALAIAIASGRSGAQRIAAKCDLPAPLHATSWVRSIKASLSNRSAMSP